MADEALIQAITDALRASNFAGWRRMVAGYKNADGSITMAGAGVGKVWARPPEDSRGGTAVWGSAAYANAPLIVGPGFDGDYEVKGADWLTASISFGEGSRVITDPPGMGELLTDSIPANSLKPGRVYLSPNGGLNFRIDKFSYASGFWDSEADQDASSFVPGTTGEVCWVAPYLDPATNTVDAVASTPVFGLPQDLSESAIAALVLPAGAIPLGPAFTLVNGQTQLSASRFAEDTQRIWLTAWDNDGSGSALPNFGTGATKTLSSGVATAGDDRHLILAAESSTTDDLIEVSGLSVGDALLLRADSGDTITVKHNDAGATDKIILSGGADYALSGDELLLLVKTESGKVIQPVDEQSTGSGSAPEFNEDSTTESSITDTSPTVGSNSASIVFTAPASGRVIITVSGHISVVNNTQIMILSYDLREGNSVGSGTVVQAANTDYSIITGRAVNTSAAAEVSNSRVHLVTGLTPGDEYNVQTLRWVSGGQGAIFYRSLLVQPA